MKTFLRKAPKVIVFILIMVFAYALLDVLYLFALNDRYKSVSEEQFVLDTWTETVYYANPARGLQKYDAQRDPTYKPPIWRFWKK